MHPATVLADPPRVPVRADPDPTTYVITAATGGPEDLTGHTVAILQWWDVATPNTRHDEAAGYGVKAAGEVVVTWSATTIHAAPGTKLFRIWSTNGAGSVKFSGLFERRVGPDVAPDAI